MCTCTGWWLRALLKRRSWIDLKASKAALFDAVVNDGSFASSRVDAEQIRELFTPTDS